VPVHDLLVNLLASVVAGTAVWSSQRLLRYQRLARKRAFFGLDRSTTCLLAVSRHGASSNELSVHRQDVAALVELATIAKDCGRQAELIASDQAAPGIGRVTEFCVGGPVTNPRAAAHLRSLLPGVHYDYDPGVAEQQPITVGTTTFRRDPGRAEYAVLARVVGPAGGRPVFLLGGQRARTNLAAARFLAVRHRELHRSYGRSRPFCLVLRVVEPAVYGPDFVEIAADVTDEALGTT
jgi:hypothetical protein